MVAFIKQEASCLGPIAEVGSYLASIYHLTFLPLSQTTMAQALLIVGATEKQSGAAVDAVLAKRPMKYLFPAVVHSTESMGAKRLA